MTAAVTGARGRRARAAATAWPPRSRRCGWSDRPTSPRSSPSPTTAALSGRLRDEFGVLPPGDLRMALAALCDDTEWGHTWRDVLQHRFAGAGELQRPRRRQPADRRPLGAARRPRRRARLVGRLLGARGRVLPMAAVPLRHRGRGPRRSTRPTRRRRRRCAARSRSRPRTGEVARIAPRAATRPGLPGGRRRRSRAADWVVLGPGSWFTSVMPHLLVPALRDALRDDRRRKRADPQPRARRPARPPASRPSTTSRCWPTTRPTCGSTSCWPTRASVDRPAQLRRRRPPSLGAELVVRRPWRRTHGTPGAARLAAAGRGVPRHHRRRPDDA